MRTLLKITISLLLLVGAASAQGAFYATSGTVCKYPSYCARTDLLPAAFQPIPPQAGPNTCSVPLYNCGNLTGKGTCFRDPSFGTLVCRVTDSTIGFPGHLFQSLIVAGSGSGDEQRFNCNSTMLLVDDGGGRTFPTSFTGSSVARIFTGDPAWTSLNGFFTNNTNFFGRNCANHPNIMYNLGNGQAGTSGAFGSLLGYWDFTNLGGLAPSFTQLFDFKSSANCLGSGFNVTWTANGGSDQFDTDFGFGFSNNGAQGGPGAIYVAVWRNGSGCRVLNLGTLTVTGDWGPTGAIVGAGCPGGTIHNIKMTKQGGAGGSIEVDYASPCGSPSTSVFNWAYTGLNFNAQCTSACSGHWTTGLSHWVNNTGNSVPNFISIRPVTAPGSPTGIIPAIPSGGVQAGMDMHLGWNGLNDLFPFFSTTATPAVNPTVAWDDEVMGFDPAGLWQWRFANTYTFGTAQTGLDFDAAYAIGSISQDGQYFAFTSDWQGTMGGSTGSNGSTGSASAIPGGPKWAATNTYAANAVINPTVTNTGTNSFQTTSGGVSGSTQPNWDSACATACVDGTVTWTNLGTPNAISHVFVAFLNESYLPHYASISWAASVTGGVTYNLYRGTSPGICPGTPYQAGLSGLSYLDKNTALGQKYYYNVSAVNGGGETCSTESSITIP